MRINSLRSLLLLSTVVAAAGCSQMAPSSVYRAFAPFSQAGYRDKQIEEGVWEVTYETDITDRSDFAERYARYRAAELASQAGFPFLQIVRVEGTTMMGIGVNTTTVKLTVRGARSQPPEVMCEVTSSAMPRAHPTPCETYATEDALRRFEPLKRRGRPSAPAPRTAPDSVAGQE